MSSERSKGSEARLEKQVELRYQTEVVERWINCSGVPAEAHPQLEEMLAHISAQMAALEAEIT